MIDEELEEFQEAMEEQGKELREALAEDLGGNPEDYLRDQASARVDGGE